MNQNGQPLEIISFSEALDCFEKLRLNVEEVVASQYVDSWMVTAAPTEYCGVSHDTMRNWANNGDVESCALGDGLRSPKRFRRSWLDKSLMSRKI